MTPTGVKLGGDADGAGSAPRAAPPPAALRVLAVNDQPDFLDALAALLSLEGYEVATTTDVKEALLRADDFAPALLIADFDMNECDGVEFLRTLADRRLLPEVPKMILSSAAMDVVRERMRDRGVEAEVMDKNGDVDELLAVIRRLCAAGDESL